jgi:RNA polymerase sigma factor (sigma-70 family)
MELTLNVRAVSAGQDDGALVAAARCGDDRAFEQLYARYRERIHAFILSKVGDHGRAEDIGQDVFMSALRQLRSCDQEIAFKPWLYTIARNACIDEFRRASRGAEVPTESDEALDAGARRRPFRCAAPTPDAAVESKQRLDDLRGAFEGLTDSQHQLLVMREFGGLGYDEIGDRLGMTKQMVESGLFRARRNLSEEYDELTSGRRCQEIQTAIDGGRLQAAKSLGVRDRRRYTRHLSHCQPCRHVAQMTGIDPTLLKPRRIFDKVAGLLPFPFVRRLLGHTGRGGVAHGGTVQVAAQVAGTTGAGASFGFGQAATVAALAIAGAGGGLLATHAVGTHHHTASTAHHVTAPATRRSSWAVAHTVARTTTPAATTSASARVTTHRTVRRTGASSARIAPPQVTPAAAGPVVSRPRVAARQTHGRVTAPVAHAPRPAVTTPAANNPASTRSSGGGTVGATSSGAATPAARTATTATARTPAATTTTDPAAAAVGSTVSGVGTTVSKAGTGVGTTVSKVGTGVGTTVSGVGTTVGSATQGLGGTVSTVPGVGPTVGSTVSSVGAGVGSTVSSVGAGVGSTVSGVGTTVSKAGTGVGSTVSTVGGAAGSLLGGS